MWNFYVYCSAFKASKYYTTTFYFTSFDFYLEWSKHVNCTIWEGCCFLKPVPIIWTPIFPLSLRQVTQLNTTDFVMELALIIQKPLSLISFKVMPPPQCAALRWHHLTINSVTLDFFSRIMGCIYYSFNSDLLIHPPTLIIPFPSINGWREHDAHALLKLLSLCFSLASSSLKVFCLN